MPRSTTTQPQEIWVLRYKRQCDPDISGGRGYIVCSTILESREHAISRKRQIRDVATDISITHYKVARESSVFGSEE